MCAGVHWSTDELHGRPSHQCSYTRSSLMDAAPAVGGAAGGSTEAEFDENDGEDLVPVLSSVLNALVQRDDKVCPSVLTSCSCFQTASQHNDQQVQQLQLRHIRQGLVDDIRFVPDGLRWAGSHLAVVMNSTLRKKDVGERTSAVMQCHWPGPPMQRKRTRR